MIWRSLPCSMPGCTLARWIQGREDRMCWVSYRRLLESFHFLWKNIWRSKAPPKMAFFAWTAALGKILV